MNSIVLKTPFTQHKCESLQFLKQDGAVLNTQDMTERFGGSFYMNIHQEI